MALRTTGSYSSISNENLLSLIRDDTEYKKFRKVIKLELERLNLEQDQKEVLSLHASRVSRTIYDKRQYSPHVLMDASTMDLAFRSRIVELRVKASLHISIMETAINSIKQYIYSKYVQNSNVFTTENSRQSYINTVLKSYISEVDKAKSFIQLCDTLVKDIDQAGFNLRNMLDCLKLISETKGKIV